MQAQGTGHLHAARAGAPEKLVCHVGITVQAVEQVGAHVTVDRLAVERGAGDGRRPIARLDRRVVQQAVRAIKSVRLNDG